MVYYFHMQTTTEETGMDESATGKERLGTERRKNTRLRAIFPDASMRIAHFFHGHNDWVKSSIDYMAERLVHEAYPDLSGAEVHSLVTAIEHRIQEA
jgi:hypothetical protein